MLPGLVSLGGNQVDSANRGQLLCRSCQEVLLLLLSHCCCCCCCWALLYLGVSGKGLPGSAGCSPALCSS